MNSDDNDRDADDEFMPITNIVRLSQLGKTTKYNEVLVGTFSVSIVRRISGLLEITVIDTETGHKLTSFAADPEYSPKHSFWGTAPKKK